MKEKTISFKYDNVAYDIFIFLLENKDTTVDFDYDVIIDVIDVEKQHQCIHSKVSFKNSIDNTDIDVWFTSDNLYLAELIDTDIALLFTDTINSSYLEVYGVTISDAGLSKISNMLEKFIKNYINNKRFDINYYNNIIHHNL